MTWIRRYKQKKPISKISVDSNFYVFKLCMLMCVSLLPQTTVLNKSRTHGFLWKLLSLHIEMISAYFFWKATKICKKFKYFENFESALYMTSGSMPLTSLKRNLTWTTHSLCFVSYNFEKFSFFCLVLLLVQYAQPISYLRCDCTVMWP